MMKDIVDYIAELIEEEQRIYLLDHETEESVIDEIIKIIDN